MNEGEQGRKLGGESSTEREMVHDTVGSIQRVQRGEGNEQLCQRYLVCKRFPHSNEEG